MITAKEIENFVESKKLEGITCASAKGYKLIYYFSGKVYSVETYKEEVLYATESCDNVVNVFNSYVERGVRI